MNGITKFTLVCMGLIVSTPVIAVQDVKDFGVTGDGVTLDTAAFQAAIDATPAGDILTVSAGQYVVGTLKLKSDFELHLEEDAELLGSTSIDDYARDIQGAIEAPAFDECLLYAENAQNLSITGPGTINGRGHSEAFPRTLSDGTLGDRPMLIRFVSCQNVIFNEVKLRDAASWCTHLVDCDDVLIQDVTLDSHVNTNNDGFDLDGCKRVLIENCNIISGDDAICPKSTTTRLCEDITVRNCSAQSNTSAFKTGTSSRGGFRNITVTDCDFSGTRMGAIKLLVVDGGILENISISNIVMNEVEGPLFIRLGNRGRLYTTGTEQDYDPDAEPEGAPVGSVKNIRISHITATVTGDVPERNGIMISGIPKHYIEDVVLENINISFPGGGTEEDAAAVVAEDEARYPEQFFFGTLPSWGAYIRHAKNVTFKNVTLTTRAPDARERIVEVDVINFTEHYSDGYEWQRSSDWTLAGSVPDAVSKQDDHGNTAWNYTTVNGGMFINDSGSDKWWTQVRTDMSPADWNSTPVFMKDLTHPYFSQSIAQMSTNDVALAPLAVWTSPVGDAVVRIGGTISWSGGGGTNTASADYVLAIHRATDDSWEVLDSTRFVPNGGTTPDTVRDYSGSHALPPLSVSRGDEIVWGFKRESNFTSTGGWINMNDSLIFRQADAGPTGLTANTGSMIVSLDWDDNSNADLESYSIYRSTTSGSYGAALATGLMTSEYVDNTVNNEVAYYYVVTSVDTNGNESAYSAEFITIPAEAGNNPPAFTSDPLVGAHAEKETAYSAVIADDANDPESDAMIFSMKSGPDWLSMASDGTLSGVPGATDMGTNSFVILVNAAGGSDTTTLEITVVDTIPTAAPTGLVATLADGAINLSWADNTEIDLNYYNVYRSTTSNNYGTALAIEQHSNEYVDSTVVNNTTYYYVVTAIDDSGNESDASHEVFATPVILTTTRYEAENATISGPSFRNSNAGFSGTGYADYNSASSDYLEWTVPATAGSADLVFGYALASGDRPLDIRVNGAFVANLSFPGTGGWSRWGETTLSVLLQEGANTIRATASGSSGGNLDYLDVVQVAVLKGYDLWATGWGTNIGANTNDFDSDGMNNLYEYGLGGNPTNGLTPTSAPAFTIAGSRGIYVYPKRSDDDSLTYTIETRTNLISGTWASEGYDVMGTNITGETLNFVTNDVDMVDTEKYIRLKIEQP